MIKKHEKINTRGGYSNSTLFARLFVMLLMCVTLLCGALFATFNNKNVSASTENSISIGKLYDETTGQFDGKVVTELYSKILGKDNATYQDVVNVVGSGTSFSNYTGTIPKALSSAELNGGQGASQQIIVNIGGYDWTIVFVTRTGQPSSSVFAGEEIIATMWLADNYIVKSKYSYASSSETTGSNPLNLYSTSMLHVVTLNAGGQYTTTGADLVYQSDSYVDIGGNQTGQNPESPWVIFTMPDGIYTHATNVSMQKKVENSLTSFIVKPNDIYYQHYITYQGSASSANTLPNESLEKPYNYSRIGIKSLEYWAGGTNLGRFLFMGSRFIGIWN